MADSCRPASRHGGRYSSNSNRIDVQYSDNLPSYSTVNYRPHEEFYGQSQTMMDTVERPKTGRGFRHTRPPSRGGREEVFDESKTGRPTSRMGFRPDTFERHDYDEFSRQDRIPVPSDQSSQESSPRGGNNSPMGYPPRNSPHGISVSPNEEYLSAQSPSAFRLLSRETVAKESPIGSPNQREYIPHSPPQQRDYGSQRSPVSSPYHRDTGSPFRSHRPGRRLRIPDQSNNEQVFDFEGDSYISKNDSARPTGYDSRYETEDPYDRRYEQDKPYTGNEHYQYYSPERQNSGDFQTDTVPSGYAPILSGKNRYQYNHYSNPNPSEEHATEVMHVHDYSQPQSTPRPRSSRPKSARKRPQSARKKRQEEPSGEQDDSNTHTSDPVVRPHSSFLRYKPLPAIGSNEPVSDQHQAEILAEQTKQLHLQEQQRPGSARRGSFTHVPFSSATEIMQKKSETIDNSSEDETGAVKNKSESSQFRLHQIPSEPPEGEERLLLAIRLPDGKRVQRYFSVADRMEVVKQYAENVLCTDMSQYNLSCNSPKSLFTDLSQLIGEVGLMDRTLLFLVEKV